MTDVLFSPRSAFRPSAADGLIRSGRRLDRPDYATDAVIAETVVDAWPGDLAGRLLLTLGRRCRAGVGDLTRLTDLFEAMLAATGGHGRFGAVLGEVVDEQQVACHGWVVSGYLQYAAVTGDQRGIEASERVLADLLLPALGRFPTYPRHRAADSAGAASGSADRVEGGWMLSTDTWCVLLALGALVPAFEVRPRDDLHRAVLMLRDALAEVDLVAEQAQLHATLAAARNFARFAELTGDRGCRDLAERLYAAYAGHGRTLNRATFNWFGRADSWTEPCAIVDSIGTALALWRLTGNARFLGDVELIEHNALAFAQREDGSFGLDSIATRQHPVLTTIHPDARWCCTVRGGLGLVELADAAAELVQNDAGEELVLVLPRAGTLTAHGWTIRIETEYPESAGLTVSVEAAPPAATPLTVRLAAGGRPLGSLAPHPGARLETALDLEITRIDGVSARGPRMLVDGVPLAACPRHAPQLSYELLGQLLG